MKVQVVFIVIFPLTFVGPGNANVNVPVDVTVPPGVVTDIVPVVPLPITAVILVALTTVNDVAAVPPKLTAVAPVKFVPVIVTVAPAPAVVGVKDEIVGACINVKVPLEVAVPPGVITEIVPVVPLATTAVILVALTTVNDAAGVPPNVTDATGEVTGVSLDHVIEPLMLPLFPFPDSSLIVVPLPSLK